jgi:ABC-type microcin C transport system duplicated ATPase subunit YejF
MGLVPNRTAPHRRRQHLAMRASDLTKKTQEEMRHIRGNKIAMIFQEPMTSLNPVYTVGGPDRRSASGCIEDMSAAEARAARHRDCCAWCASPSPRGAASTTIRTSCRAACASA